MTKSTGVSVIRLWVLAVLVLAATSWAQTHSPVAEKIAKTYGVDSWGQVEAIRYTWNGEIPGVFKLTHTWEWEPQTGQVTCKKCGRVNTFGLFSCPFCGQTSS